MRSEKVVQIDQGAVVARIQPAECEKHGPFEIQGEPEIMGPMDELMASFVAQGRMKLPGKTYNPCYRIVAA